VLHLSIPAEMADPEYFVLVELHPLLKEWPPGYIEETFGSITDESFFPEIPNEEQTGP